MKKAKDVSRASIGLLSRDRDTESYPACLPCERDHVNAATYFESRVV